MPLQAQRQELPQRCQRHSRCGSERPRVRLVLLRVLRQVQLVPLEQLAPRALRPEPRALPREPRELRQVLQVLQERLELRQAQRQRQVESQQQRVLSVLR